MAPYEALYSKKYITSVYWDEVGERKILDPDIVHEIAEIVTKVAANCSKLTEKLCRPKMMNVRLHDRRSNIFEGSGNEKG